MTEIILTHDGSHSLRNSELNETYHSIHGALNESIHVFIKNGLEYFREANPEKDCAVLEIGFGTGLNALLSLQFANQHNLKVHFTTLEAFPLSEAIWSKLNYSETLQLQSGYTKLHTCLWNKDQILTPNFTILKLKTTLQDVVLKEEQYDVIYFDAFAPNKQPEMWTLEILSKIARAMKPAAVFVTYCAKGQLKRDLKEVGLLVETLSGPPGKKEMVRATKV